MHAIGVGSGTEALWLSFLALGVGPGDEVITVPNTFMATAEAITYCGAIPVFVDVDERTYTMDPELLEQRHARTKAIIPVHLFGQPADMDPILEVARRAWIFVVMRMPARRMGRIQRKEGWFPRRYRMLQLLPGQKPRSFW